VGKVEVFKLDLQLGAGWTINFVLRFAPRETRSMVQQRFLRGLQGLDSGNSGVCRGG